MVPTEAQEQEEDSMEEEGMTEKQFASYLNQVIGRLEDVLEVPDPERREEKLAAIVASLKEDRDSNL